MPLINVLRSSYVCVYVAAEKSAFWIKARRDQSISRSLLIGARAASCFSLVRAPVISKARRALNALNRRACDWYADF